MNADIKDYNRYFDFYGVVRALVAIRVRTMAGRRRSHFLNDLCAGYSDGRLEQINDVDRLLPPRSMWSRSRNRNGMSQADITSDSIIRTVMGVYFKGRIDEYEWSRRLYRFYKEIKRKQCGLDGFAISKPEIRQITRAAASDKLRLVSVYNNLADKVLIGQTGRYFMDVFDGLLCDSVYSFRAKAGFDRSEAVRRLIEYRKANAGKILYTAECDIKGFFDNVSHAAVLRCLEKCCCELADSGIVVDRRAREVFRSYINSYNYKNACREAGIEAGNVPQSTGIAAGGSLSLAVSNLILSGADKAVLKTGSGHGIYYARYCDDMLICSEDQGLCDEMLEAYIREVEAEGLQVHKPQVLEGYSSAVYDIKSKSSYPWAAGSDSVGAIPWVPFLGYQVRYDGSVRIREESIERHKQKLKEEVRMISGSIKRFGIRKRLNMAGVLRRVALRLVGMSVGRPYSGKSISETGLCWAGAFHLVDNNVSSTAQVVKLDRHREGLFRFLRNILMGKAGVSRIEEKQCFRGLGRLFNYHKILIRRVRPKEWLRRVNSGDLYDI